MAEKACHVVASTTQVGLIPVLCGVALRKLATPISVRSLPRLGSAPVVAGYRRRQCQRLMHVTFLRASSVFGFGSIRRHGLWVVPDPASDIVLATRGVPVAPVTDGESFGNTA